MARRSYQYEYSPEETSGIAHRIISELKKRGEKNPRKILVDRLGEDDRFLQTVLDGKQNSYWVQLAIEKAFKELIGWINQG